MLDGVYRLTDGVPLFQAIPAPTTEQLQAVLTRIITSLLKMLTRKGALTEEDTEDSEPPGLADPRPTQSPGPPRRILPDSLIPPLDSGSVPGADTPPLPSANSTHPHDAKGWA